jgi:membrane protease subunit (stomatin/prohibitin family)
MDRRVFHGNISPIDVARALMAEFNQGNTQTQLLGEGGNLTIQIASSSYSRSGGKTAVSVNLQQIEDGVMVQVGEQQWLGVAASLGQTAISALLNPLNLLGRLDDIAQDVSSMQMSEKIWQVVVNVARNTGASQELSERLSSLTCDFCGAANAVAAPSCIACGAPLGKSQPKACSKCGFVLTHDEKFCPNCGQVVSP